MTIRQFIVVIEPDEDAYHAFVPALPGCHTFGATIEEAKQNIREAIELHIEGMIEDGEEIPVGLETILITHVDVAVA